MQRNTTCGKSCFRVFTLVFSLFLALQQVVSRVKTPVCNTKFRQCKTNMAEPEQEPGLLDSTGTHSLCDETTIVDGDQVQVVTSGLSDELVRQALVEANDFDSSTIRSIYAVAGEGTEVCDTGQTSVEVSSGLSVISTDQNIPSAENTLSSSSESALVNNTDSIFTNGSEALMTNGGSDSDVLGVESNGTYTVDVGSLQENQIISVSNDIIPGSVIISQPSQEQLHQAVETPTMENGLLPGESHNLIQQIDTQFVHESDSNMLPGDSSTQIIQSEGLGRPQAIRVTAPHGLTMTQEVLQNVIQQVQAQQLAAAEKKDGTSSPESSANQNNTLSFTLVSSSSSPPLGSSQNPIRIIQQGNRYTPVQQLSTEQLQQIMQVVQQQHVSKNAQDNGGTVIFNPQTNTRIMYRVIYPSELHKAQNAGGHETYQVVRPTTSTQEQQTSIPHQKRQYRKRKLDIQAVPAVPGEEDGTDKGNPDTPELSKEEKEERKKHRPRTRSGRVSKPPKHMVQDYKHIHVLDWDEDYDDSDGGYSDFKHSDEEGKVKQEGEEVQSPSPDFFPALGAGKPKNHKCQTCDKSYIGQAGLARHYRLNPDHCSTPLENGSSSSLHNGSLDGEDSKDASLQEGSLSLMSDTPTEGPKAGGLDNFSEDSNTQDSLNSTGASSPVVRRGRGRGGFRGRGAHFRYNAQIRRKSKLKELMKKCSDEELMEVVLPRLVTGVSLWEFLLMKSEKGGSKPQVDVVYREFEALKRRVKQVCSDYMKPLSAEELEDDNLQCKMIKVTDASMALCLGLERVTYRVEEMPQDDPNTFSSLHNKLSAAAIAVAPQPAPGVPVKIVIKAENGDPEETKAGSQVATPTSATLKRTFDDFTTPDKNENPSKRVKLSSFSPWRPIEGAVSTSSSVSPGTTNSSLFTIAAHLPATSDEKMPLDRSDSSLSSMSSHSASSTASPKSQPVSTSSQPPPPPSSSSSSSSSLSSSSSVSVPAYKPLRAVSVVKSEPSTSTVQISIPASKHQAVSYILKSNAKQNGQANGQTTVVGHRASQPQTVPVVINTGQGGASTAQVMPYILGSTNGAGGSQKVVIAAPAGHGNQQHEPLPILLAPSGNHPQNSTVLLSSGTGVGTHRVIVRQPVQPQPQPQQTISNSQPTQVIFSPQQSPTMAAKSRPKQGTSLLPPRIPSSSKSASTPPSRQSPSPRSLLSLKPTEVKVSRQLFHDTTTSQASSSPLVNGRGNAVNGSLSTEASNFVSAVKPVVVASASNPSHHPILGSGVDIDKSVLKIDPEHLSLIQSSEHSFIAGASTIVNDSDGGMDVKQVSISDPDLEALSSGVLGLSGEDELGPLNTSTDSLSEVYTAVSSSTPQISTVTHMEGASLADSLSLIQSQAADGSAPTLVATASSHVACVVPSDPQSLDTLSNGNLHPGVHGISLINGSSSDFTSDFGPVKLKESNGSSIKSGVLSSLSPSTTTQSSTFIINSSVSDFINIARPSSPIMSSPSKEALCSLTGTTINIGTNGAISSQILRNDDVPSLQFRDPGESGVKDVRDTNGSSPLGDQESRDDLNNLLPQQIVNQVSDSGEVGLVDTLVGETEEAQPLLTEGTNIYQTEDGTLIIQSADGNTYQLQGAQDLPLETVQALLSGTMDQLTMDAGVESHADIQLH
ncbi:uncharacterized protein LOC101849909 [Aplysia californica]|uniref:Uncharacterized protein LOC101849909 n=1 Tax=Aplysia californica TaxID=6500 RepID=A0ABM0JGD4_APLCA|nr:uncharacterized protein LOC101849909 [Aplysia californica]